jgi:hypothetical protein
VLDKVDDVPSPIEPRMDRADDSLVQVHGLTMVIVVQEPDFVDTSRVQNRRQIGFLAKSLFWDGVVK